MRQVLTFKSSLWITRGGQLLLKIHTQIYAHVAGGVQQVRHTCGRNLPEEKVPSISRWNGTEKKMESNQNCFPHPAKITDVSSTADSDASWLWDDSINQQLWQHVAPVICLGDGGGGFFFSRGTNHLDERL